MPELELEIVTWQPRSRRRSVTGFRLPRLRAHEPAPRVCPFCWKRGIRLDQYGQRSDSRFDTVHYRCGARYERVRTPPKRDASFSFTWRRPQEDICAPEMTVDQIRSATLDDLRQDRELLEWSEEPHADAEDDLAFIQQQDD